MKRSKTWTLPRKQNLTIYKIIYHDEVRFIPVLKKRKLTVISIDAGKEFEENKTKQKHSFFK